MDFLVAAIQVTDAAKGGDPPRQQVALAVFLGLNEDGPVSPLKVGPADARSGYAPWLGNVQEKDPAGNQGPVNSAEQPGEARCAYDPGQTSS